MLQLVKRDPEPEEHEAMRRRDTLFLFACHIKWRDNRDVKAYQELLAALDDPNEDIRAIAESLLQRASPRPRRDRRQNPSGGDLR